MIDKVQKHIDDYRRHTSRLKKMTTDVIDTPNRTFNKQAEDTYVGPGNVWGTVQYSSYIRPNVSKFSDFDLKPFRDSVFRVRAVTWPEFLDTMNKHLEEKSGILYRFGHRIVPGRFKYHGLVFTDDNYRLIGYTYNRSDAGRSHSYEIMQTVLPFVSWKKEDYPDD